MTDARKPGPIWGGWWLWESALGKSKEDLNSELLVKLRREMKKPSGPAMDHEPTARLFSRPQ